MDRGGRIAAGVFVEKVAAPCAPHLLLVHASRMQSRLTSSAASPCSGELTWRSGCPRTDDPCEEEQDMPASHPGTACLCLPVLILLRTSWRRVNGSMSLAVWAASISLRERIIGKVAKGSIVVRAYSDEVVLEVRQQRPQLIFENSYIALLGLSVQFPENSP